jgi:hypothetical protein
LNSLRYRFWYSYRRIGILLTESRIGLVLIQKPL